MDLWWILCLVVERTTGRDEATLAEDSKYIEGGQVVVAGAVERPKNGLLRGN